MEHARPVYLFNPSPSEGPTNAVHYSASIDLLEGEAMITKVGFSRLGTVIHDREGRAILLDGTAGYSSKVQDWTGDCAKLMNERSGRFRYPVEELDAIRDAFDSYVSSVEKEPAAVARR